MSNVVSKQLTSAEVNQIYIPFLKKYQSQIPKNNLNIIFFAKYCNWTITIFKTNKLLVQGLNAQDFFNKLTTKKNTSTNSFNQYQMISMGSDEVGNGVFFGGVCVCACLIKPKDIELLKKLNITDSKKISDKKIIEITDELKKAKIKYFVLNWDAQTYNNWYAKCKNLNAIKAIMHNEALSHFNNEKNSFTIIDQFVDENNYYSYLKKMNIKNIKKIDLFQIKAESKYYAVATASIIARYEWIKQIDNLSKKLNYKIPQGYNLNEIKKICNMIGKKNLSKYCKLNFKTIKDLNL